jgi:hypothetical protein
MPWHRCADSISTLDQGNKGLLRQSEQFPIGDLAQGVDCRNETLQYLCWESTNAIDGHIAAGEPLPSVLADAASFLIQVEVSEMPQDVQQPI